MKQRYVALALTDWGDSDPDDGFVAGSETYQECVSNDLPTAIHLAETASIIDECQCVYVEEYRPQYCDWIVVDSIDPYHHCE